jgi:hypothetical protein
LHEISKAAKAFESEPEVAFGFVDASQYPDMADKYSSDTASQHSWLRKHPASFTRTFLAVLPPDRAQATSCRAPRAASYTPS